MPRKSVIVTGIILQTIKSGEYNRLITVLTPDFGIIKALAYNAEKPKSRFCSTLLPFTEATFYLQQDQNTGFYSITDISTPLTAVYFKTSLQMIYLFSYYSYIMLNTPVSPHEFKIYYYLIKYSIELVEKYQSPYKSYLFFTCKLITLHGQNIHFSNCSVCAHTGDNLCYSRSDHSVFCKDHISGPYIEISRSDALILDQYTTGKYIFLTQYNDLPADFAGIRQILTDTVKHIYHGMLPKLDGILSEM